MSIYSRFISVVKFLTPLVICILFCIITIMPIMPLGYESITPLLGVVSMAFWIVHRPDIMSWLFVILIGFFCDILYGSLLGVGIFASISIRLFLIRILPKIELTNIYHSIFYITISVIIWLSISILLNSIINMELLNLSNSFFQALISIIISPIVIFFQLYLFKIITS